MKRTPTVMTLITAAVVALWAAAASAQPQNTFGVHVGEELWSGELVNGVPSTDYQQNIDDFFTWIRQKQYTVVLFNIADGSGVYFFTDPTLRSLGWTPASDVDPNAGDILQRVVDAATAPGQTRVEVIPTLDVIAWSIYGNTFFSCTECEGPDLTQYGAILDNLLGNYDVAGIVEESFGQDYIDLSFVKANQYRRTYEHRTDCTRRSGCDATLSGHAPVSSATR